MSASQQSDLHAKIIAVTKIGNSAAESNDPMIRMGALVAYAGVVDLLVIQSGRLVEEIIVKGDLEEGRPPRILPNEDRFFFERKLATGKLLKEIRRLLSRQNLPEHDRPEVREVIEATDSFVGRAFAFLDERDFVFHRIGHPDTMLADWLARVDLALAAYKQVLEAHCSFATKAGPFRLTLQQHATVSAAKAQRASPS